MSDDEKAFPLMEEEIPAKAGEVFAVARARALAAGHSLVEARNEYLYHVHPDGREFVIKKLEPHRHYRAGQKFIIP